MADNRPGRVNKTRYWAGVLYPENMVDGWEELAEDALQVPFAYCVHDADHNTDGEDRKTHVHFILAFPNTTTYSHALSVFRLLGEKAINKCEAVIGIRHAWDYLIHDTDASRKAGKHQYSPSERITGNNFDIGSYEQISTADKNAMLQELCDYIVEFRIENFADFYIGAMQNFGPDYFEVIKANNAFLDRLTRGAYLRAERKRAALSASVSEQHGMDTEEAESGPETAENGSQQHENGSQQHEKTCPKCGTANIKKQGKTASGLQRYACKKCGRTFV